MRVLQLGPFPPPHGGVQTNLVAIREYLRQQAIPCAVINVTRFRKAASDEVYYPRHALELVWLLVRLRYDILHLHIGGDLSRRLLALSLVCTLVPGAKAVLTFHSGGYPSSPAGKTARQWTLRGLVLRRFDGLIGVNAEIVALFRRFGVRAERIRLIHPHALAGPAPGAELPASLAEFWKSHAPVLLTVGLLEPEYDLPLQMEALGKLRERHPRAGLVILGAGSIERELRQAAAAKPYAEHIRLAGDVPHEATLRAIAECGVFLRTTLYDGDSISVREALYLGAPVIATRNGMRPEGVREIPVGDIEALVAAIEAGLERGGARRPEGGAGQENLRAVLDFYRELLAG